MAWQQRPPGGGRGRGAGPPEKRIDPEDGCEYTMAEFVECYGGLQQWEAAIRPGAAGRGPAPAAPPTAPRAAPQPPPPGAPPEAHLAYVKAYEDYLSSLTAGAAGAAPAASAAPPAKRQMSRPPPQYSEPSAAPARAPQPQAPSLIRNPGAPAAVRKSTVAGARVKAVVSGAVSSQSQRAQQAALARAATREEEAKRARLREEAQHIVLLFGTLCDLQPPRVRIQQTGAAHQPTFTHTMELDVRGQTVTATASATAKRVAEAECYVEMVRVLEEQCADFQTYLERLQRADVGNIDPTSIMSLWLPREVQQQMEAITRLANSIPSGPPAQEPLAPAEAMMLLRPELRDPRYQRQRGAELEEGLQQKLASPGYRRFAAVRSGLPIAQYQAEICETVRDHPVVLICGDTGSGKSTQVPQFLLDDAVQRGRGGQTNIVVTQPRRISCVAVASRIAEERCEPVGEQVGYAIRLDSKIGRSVNCLTCGVLLRALNASHRLDGISHLVLDEVHERDINSDFLLILVKDLVQARPDLKVILMSATVNASLFSKYFWDCPIIRIPGRLFPVQEIFLEDLKAVVAARGNGENFVAVQMMDMPKKRHSSAKQVEFEDAYMQRAAGKRLYSEMEPDGGDDGDDDDFEEPPLTHSFEEDEDPIDYNLIAFLCDYLVSDPSSGFLQGGSILVFLPGWHELTAAKAVLESGAFGEASRFQIHIVHSSVRQEEQNEIFTHAPEGKTKVILSTNICESGLTIDDVAAVIDSGKLKERSYGSSGVESIWEQLVCIQATKANCIQRAGRAGRTQQGLCFRLFTRAHYADMADYQTPELLRSPLDSLCLQILALDLGDPREFLRKALEPPPPRSAADAVERLSAQSAVTLGAEGPALTPLGRRLAQLPLQPRVGKMLLVSSILGCLDAVLTIAASSGTEPFVTTPLLRKQVQQSRLRMSQRSLSDAVSLANAYNGWITALLQGREREYCEEHHLSHQTLTTVSKVKKQLYVILVRSGWLEDDSGVRTARECFVDTGPQSQYSSSPGLVKCCLAVGLYPNVAVHREKATYRTKHQARIFIHPRSVLKKEREFGNPWFLFEEQVVSLSKRLYLREVSNLSPYSIILMGASLDSASWVPELQLLVVDGWMMFKCPQHLVPVLQGVKRAISEAIMRRFADPRNATNNELLEEISALVDDMATLPLRPNMSLFSLDPSRGRNVRVSEKGFTRMELGTITPPILCVPLPREAQDAPPPDAFVHIPADDADAADALGAAPPRPRQPPPRRPPPPRYEPEQQQQRQGPGGYAPQNGPGGYTPPPARSGAGGYVHPAARGAGPADGRAGGGGGRGQPVPAGGCGAAQTWGEEAGSACAGGGGGEVDAGFGDAAAEPAPAQYAEPAAGDDAEEWTQLPPGEMLPCDSADIDELAAPMDGTGLGADDEFMDPVPEQDDDIVLLS